MLAQANARALPIDGGIVQCIITSPPYFGLRDYGIPDQMGLENTVDEYLATTRMALAECWRVLRSDGVLFYNIGDSYASTAKGKGGHGHKQDTNTGSWFDGRRVNGLSPGLKQKDLCLIPERVALLAQEMGWWVRSRIIWHKSNAMPESVRDRPTVDYETVWMFTKSARYFWDSEAVKEPAQEWVGQATTFKRENGKATELVIPGQSKVSHRPDRKQDAVGRRTYTGFDDRWDARPPEPMRNLRTVWSLPTAPYADAHYACVDAETECLTAEGWKRYDQLREGELAAQYSLATQKLSWGKIQQIAIYDVQDETMVCAHSRDLNVLLTANHRCVIHRRHPHTRKIQPPIIVRADELKASHSVPTTAEWDYQGLEPVSPEWAELIGWYIAEGHESKDSLAVEIYQSESANPDKVTRIAELLKATEAEWSMTRASRKWRGSETISTAFRVKGYAAVRLREFAPGKNIPCDALLWSDELIAAILRGMVEGDGNRREDDRLNFVQKNHRTADMVQALAIRLGMSATVSPRAGGMLSVYLTKHKTRSFRGTNGRNSPPGQIQYTGAVWCPRLPEGTWVARREGRVFITGNTFPPALPRRCILAATSPRACGVCGAPWERVTEQGNGHQVRWKPGPDKHTVAVGGKGKTSAMHTGIIHEQITTGWRPTCAHDDPGNGKCLVLDPFCGSGTTVAVAVELGRTGIGFDLSYLYLRDHARKRLAGTTIGMAL